jgi:hypothetical protein
VDTTISWMIGGSRADRPDERTLAHLRALREAGAVHRGLAGRFGALATAALAGLRGRRASASATTAGGSLDTACCLA